MEAESVVDNESTDKLGQKAVRTIDIFIDSAPKFYYVSDIHLELRKKPPRDLIESIIGGIPHADHIRRSILLLAGDIGNPSDVAYELFLKRCESFFAYVIIIAGNHEYYTSNTKQRTVRVVNREMIKACARSKAILVGAGDNDSPAVRVDIYTRDGKVTPSEGSTGSSFEGDYSLICTADSSSACESSDISGPDCAIVGGSDCSDCSVSSNCSDRSSVSSVSGGISSDQPRSDASSNDQPRGDLQIDVSSVDLDANSVKSAIYAMSNAGKIYDSKLVARVVGCTLWTAPSETAAIYMNDYRRIFVEGPTGRADRSPKEGLMRMDFMAPTRVRARPGVRNINTNDVYYGMHQPQLAYLKDEIELAKADGAPLIVMTHHLPSFDLLAEKNTASECYATDLTALIASPVIAWICGHTHKSLVKDINGVYCGINCFGYPTQKPSDTNFKSMYFEVADGKVISKMI